MEIIDFYTQPYPGRISELLPEKVREKTKNAALPISAVLHEVRPFLRFLPPLGRDLLGKIADHALHAPFLLFESSAESLISAMRESNVARAVIAAEHPRTTNDFVLDLAVRHSTLIPAVEIAGPVESPVETLHQLRDRGARLLKVTDASPERLPLPLLEELLEEAVKLKMPVLLRGARDREALIEAATGTLVVLVHMGGDEVAAALDLAERYPHVHLETSRQPIEALTEGVRRVGVERLLYGSDWPKIGNNMPVALRRIRDGIRAQMITEEQAELILGANARRVLEGVIDAGSA